MKKGNTVRFLRKEYKPSIFKKKQFIYAALIPKNQVVSEHLVSDYLSSEQWYDMVSGEYIVPDTKDNKLVFFYNLGELFEYVYFLFPRHINKPILTITRTNQIFPGECKGKVEILIPRDCSEEISWDSLLFIDLDDRDSNKSMMGINLENYNVFDITDKIKIKDGNLNIIEKLRELGL